MAQLSKSLNLVNLNQTNTTPTNNILAASATVTRWIRGFVVVNNGSAGSFNLGWGTAAIMTAANSEFFGIAIAAGASFPFFYPGKGARLTGTDVIMAFASAANMSLVLTYDELDLT